MNNAGKYVFRTFMMQKLAEARSEKHLTQAKFAKLLRLDTRSYIAMEKGDYSCSALTLMMYLIYCCHDVPGFVEEVKELLPQIIQADEGL